MEWRALTTDDLLSTLAGAEKAALESAAKASGQANPITQTQTLVTEYVRGQIQSGGGSLDGTDTVPVAALYHAAALWRFRALTRLGSIKISEERKADADKAEVYFTKVAEGKIKFPVPDSPTEVGATGGGVELVETTCRPARRNRPEDLAGL